MTLPVRADGGIDVAHTEARRKMRALLLALNTPNAKEIEDQYYTTITLAEHIAAAHTRERCAFLIEAFQHMPFTAQELAAAIRRMED